MGNGKNGKANQSTNTALHGSQGDLSRNCEQCGNAFKPRIVHGANASRFCGTPCRDLWHNRKRREEKQSPLSVAADQAGGETKQKHNLSAPDNTPRITKTPIRAGTKLAAVLSALAEGQTLNRFEAERVVHDHTLNSTISEIEKRGVRVDRKEETVRGYRGNPTRVSRYWLADDQREAAKRLLGSEP